MNDEGARPQVDPEHERRLRIVGQLAGGIAHDFNNLLTAILGAADAILERAETTAETAADAQQIRRGVQRGAALVRQLLAFSRQQTLQPRIVDVNAAIDDTAQLLRRLLGARMTVVIALEQPGRRVMADPGQLDQVLMNLAVNARDAMADGGTLTLSSGHTTLYRPQLTGAETIPPGRYVTITVADTGDGIAEAVLPRIFEPFFTTKRGQGGTGLGLPTVLGIVRQSGGFLDVASQPGIGTTVVIYLPRHETAAEAIAPATPAPVPPTQVPPAIPEGGDRVVLVVEDEEPVRRVLARALTSRRLARGCGGDGRGGAANAGGCGWFDRVATLGCRLRRSHAGNGRAGTGPRCAPSLPQCPRGAGFRLRGADAATGTDLTGYLFLAKALRDRRVA